MFKKLLAILLICCLAFTMLAGCGRAASAEDEPRRSVTDTNDGRDNDSDRENTDATDTDRDSGWGDLDVDFDFDIDLDDFDDVDDDGSVAEPASSDITITIDPPAGWTEEEITGSNILSYQKVDEETFDVSLFSVFEGYAYGETTPMGVAEQQMSSIAEYYEDAEFSGPEGIAIDGRDAARFDLLMELGSIEQIQVYVYFFEGNQVYVLQGAYMADDQQGAEDIEDILNSVKIG